MITFAAISKQGGRRVNEDAVSITELRGDYMFALADGLGGHTHGAAASSLAVKTSIAAFEQTRVREDGLLPFCLMESQRALREAQQAHGADREMLTTLVLLRVIGGRACWAHVGDSRLYWFRRAGGYIRTLDHSVPQMLVASGELREKDIRFHEDRARLVRVLGADWSGARYAFSPPQDVGSPSSFLLCSDGFWELVLEREMAFCLRRAKAPEEWLSRMEKILQKRGRGKQMDNYSAIAVWIRG